jgi:hypothetical protein
VGVVEVRQDTGDTMWAGDFIVLYVKGNENNQLGTGIFAHHKTV